MIEMDVLGKPIGKQDQFIAAYGGQRFIKFCSDDAVEVESLDVDPGVMRAFGRRLMLFNTSVSRKAESVLAEQSQRTDVNMEALRAMKQLALEARTALSAGDLDHFGCLLHETWMLKRSLASRITSPEIDDFYNRARSAGAQGGKITGAGGGGYLLLFCPPEKQEAVRQAVAGLDELYINLERDGSKVIFNNRR